MAQQTRNSFMNLQSYLCKFHSAMISVAPRNWYATFNQKNWAARSFCLDRKHCWLYHWTVFPGTSSSIKGHLSVKRLVMCEENMAFWRDDVSLPRPPLMGFVQFNSDKTIRTLKAEPLIAYYVHAVLFNISLRCQKGLLTSRYTRMGSLPVDIVRNLEHIVWHDFTSIHGLTSFATVDFESMFLRTSGVSGTFQNLDVFHKVLNMLLKSSKWCKFFGFPAAWKFGINGTCIHSVEAYDCDVSKAKNSSCLRYDTRMQGPYVACLVRTNDNQDPRTCQLRTGIEPKEVQITWKAYHHCTRDWSPFMVQKRGLL